MQSRGAALLPRSTSGERRCGRPPCHASSRLLPHKESLHHADTLSFFFLAFSMGGREILKAVLE